MRYQNASMQREIRSTRRFVKQSARRGFKGLVDDLIGSAAAIAVLAVIFSSFT